MEWISVKDRLPELDKNVLTWDGDSIFICAKTDRENGSMPYIVNGWDYQICTCCDMINRRPTHWMELPKAPND